MAEKMSSEKFIYRVDWVEIRVLFVETRVNMRISVL